MEVVILRFATMTIGTGSKSESVSIAPHHVKMSNLTAQINIFTACNKMGDELLFTSSFKMILSPKCEHNLRDDFRVTAALKSHHFSYLAVLVNLTSDMPLKAYSNAD